MATIYAPPQEMPVPQIDLSLSIRERMEVEDKWIERLRRWVKQNGSGQYAGKVIKDQVADGYAMYMVFSLRPLILIHLPLGDAYQSRWDHRWIASDVKQMVEREETLHALFSKKG